MKVLALVTARGGSKGMPGKNLHPVGGKPMIFWTLAAARASRYVSDILISTDDPDIVTFCRDEGFDVPFTRPAALAQDDTPHSAVIDHAMAWWAKAGRPMPDYLLLLQPTSPLRLAADIDEAIALAVARSADAVVSVCETPHHPYWMKTLSASGTIESFLASTDIPARRQDLPRAYVSNGAVYLIRASLWPQHKTFQIAGSLGFVMPRERSVDVDDASDAAFCDYLLEKSNG